jgi:hypothetical protein
MNTAIPEIFSWQFCNGPIFGERTEEVIDYVKKHKREDFLVVI